MQREESREEEFPIDFGSGYRGRWVGWHPDRSIPQNFKQYHDVQDIEKSTLLISCPHTADNLRAAGGLHPDTPEVRRVFPNGPHWQVVSWEPLHLEPSISMPCGCHGWIRDGKWENA